jgi:SsrA-binding protein
MSGILAENKKALFNYELIDSLEAGVVLQGWEVKSIKSKRASLKESYVIIENGKILLRGVNVAMWQGKTKGVETGLEARDR